MGRRRVSLWMIDVYEMLRCLQARIFRQVTKHWPQHLMLVPRIALTLRASKRVSGIVSGYTAEPNIQKKKQKKQKTSTYQHDLKNDVCCIDKLSLPLAVLVTRLLRPLA